jgi:hypothetical protein
VTAAWTPRDTTTHQDHVIAHVLGATLRGYFILAEALYILLDIGFIWTIFVDGEMGLLPHPVAVNELEIDAEARRQIKSDIDLLLGSDEFDLSALLQLSPPPGGESGPIADVSFFADGARRRLIIAAEDNSLAVETSLASGEVLVMSLASEEANDANDGNDGDNGVELRGVAKSEHEYLHQRLREELGRDPTETELDEWLRQHTEGY